jgi:hypothetical protein
MREGNTQDWITNPFYTTAINSSDLALKLKENLLEMPTDGLLKIKLKNVSICGFWIAVCREFKELCDAAILHLLPFPSTYLCEQGFSALTSLTMKQRNSLNSEPAPVLTITKVCLQIEVLACQK